ncbi:MAG: 7TM diverse intracellular signaling domain-containing protein [Ferruginibacter sp.]
MKRLIFLQVFLALFLLPYFTRAQAPVPVINTDTVQNIAYLNGSCELFIDSAGTVAVTDLQQQRFVPLTDFLQKKYIPQRLVDKNFYLRFIVANPSDSVRNYFIYPGKLYERLVLLKLAAGQPVMLYSKGVESGFVPFSVASHATDTLILKAGFFRMQFNTLQFTMVESGHLVSFQNRMYNNMTPKKTIGIVLSGMLLMMIIVTLLNFFITKRIEFLYNSLYSFCMFLLIFFTTYLSFRPGWFKGFFISYLDMFLLMAGIIFYIQFTRHFLESAKKHPKLDKFFRVEVIVLLLFLAGYSILHFGFNNLRLELITEVVIKTIIILAGIFYIFLAFVQKNKLTKYLAGGVGVQIFFYIISLLLGLHPTAGETILSSPFFYFQIGVISSVLFFLIGLFYKTRQELIMRIQEQEALKTEAEKQEYEHKLSIYKAQQEERNRISADMHDELGAGMTSIRLFSELAKAKMGEDVTPEIEKISSSSNELINKMNAIIWSMSSENDSLANMVAYIRSYGKEYLENTGIDHTIIIPDNLPDLQVPGTIRRNIFLVIKEALQNIVKHSGAKKVDIELQREPDALRLFIHDDGKGIDFDNIRPFSNGLTNMKKRMEAIGVEFSIEKKNGTLITLYGKIF